MKITASTRLVVTCLFLSGLAHMTNPTHFQFKRPTFFIKKVGLLNWKCVGFVMWANPLKNKQVTTSRVEAVIFIFQNVSDNIIYNVLLQIQQFNDFKGKDVNNHVISRIIKRWKYGISFTH